MLFLAHTLFRKIKYCTFISVCSRWHPSRQQKTVISYNFGHFLRKLSEWKHKKGEHSCAIILFSLLIPLMCGGLSSGGGTACQNVFRSNGWTHHRPSTCFVRVPTSPFSRGHLSVKCTKIELFNVMFHPGKKWDSLCHCSYHCLVL